MTVRAEYASIAIRSVVLAGLFLFASRAGSAADDIFVRSNPKTYHVRVSLTLSARTAKPSILLAELPIPQADDYQEVSHIGSSEGSIQTIPETGDEYLAVEMTDNAPAPGESREFYVEFEATLYDLSVDFDKITELRPYNTGSAEYRQYTGNSGEYVVADNPTITRIAIALEKEAKDDLDFARRAYDYVASHYRYMEDRGSLRRLEDVLGNGGGDCAGLSSIFISLLRHRGIPARHLAGFLPDGRNHTLADFYLEGYGWIPVDVTFRQRNRKTDHFGKLIGGDNIIVVSHGVDLTVADTQGQSKIYLLQKYRWWTWYDEGDAGTMDEKFAFTVAEKK